MIETPDTDATQVRSQLRILVFAYACEPGRGSEPEAGWLWVRMLARLGDVVVVTRSNNRTAIETMLPLIPERATLRFTYVDLPAWARFWKRGHRGVRLYYMLWQIAALRAARQTHKEETFDFAWHVTLSNAWLGSVGGLLGIPFIYGPIGGGVPPPWRLISALGLRGSLYEVTRACARASGRYLNPLARLAWRDATVILVQNPETQQWFPRRHRDKCRLFQHVVLEKVPECVPSAAHAPTALYAGRLLAWKGCFLALQALSHAPRWNLVLCGTGSDETRLRRQAVGLGVEGRVSFLGWRPREEVQGLMATADVFIAPSLREDASFAVLEALASGLPVLCLDRGGPQFLVGDAGEVVAAGGSADSIAREIGDRLSTGVLPTPETARKRAADFIIENRLKDLTALLRLTTSS